MKAKPDRRHCQIFLTGHATHFTSLARKIQFQNSCPVYDIKILKQEAIQDFKVYYSPLKSYLRKEMTEEIL